MENLGLTLKRLRQQKGMRLADVQRLIDIDHGYISKMEKGKMPIGMNSLVKLCEAYNVYPWQVLLSAQIGTRISEEKQKNSSFSLVYHRHNMPDGRLVIIQQGMIQDIKPKPAAPPETPAPQPASQVPAVELPDSERR